MSDNEIPRRYLTMTLRVYSINAETRERTYLPVSEPNPNNAGFGPCSCPDCAQGQAARTAEAAQALEQAQAAAALLMRAAAAR